MKLLAYLLALLTVNPIYAADFKTQVDINEFGRQSSSATKVLKFNINQGVNNPTIESNVTDQDIMVKSDLVRVGKPTVGTKVLDFNQGLGASNPKVRYNSSTAKFEFSNNGTDFKSIGSGGGGAGGITIIADGNPDFEGGTGSWTASGGSFTIATSGSNLLFDLRSGVFNASAASQTLSNALVAVPNGLKNNSGVASCWFKTTATDYKLQVYNGSTVLAENTIPALSDPAQVYVPFVFPSSGSVQARIISQSDAADIAIDNCFLGESVGRELIQAAFFGSAVDQASCQYSNSTSGSFQDMPQATGTCGVYTYTGGLSASGLAGPQPSFQIADMPAGDYQITVTGVFACANDAATQDCAFALYDGTTRYDPQGTLDSENGGFGAVPVLSFLVSKGASSTNQVFRIQSYVSTQATINVDGSAGTSKSPLSFKVIRFPSKSEQAQRVNEQPSWAASKIVASGPTTSLNTTAASFTTLSHADFAAMTKTYLGSAAVCSNANDVCMKVGKLKQGVYEVKYNGALYSGTSDDCGFRMFDGTSSIGAFRNVSQTAQHGAPGFQGILVVDSDVYDKEISLQAFRSSGAGAGCSAYFDTLATGGEVQFSIIPIGMSISDLILKNSKQIINPTQYNEVTFRFASGADCSSDPCTIDYQSGGLSAVNRTGVGSYRYVFNAGVFAQAPVCVGTYGSSAGFVFGSFGAGNTYSATQFELSTLDAANAGQDSRGFVTCSGPKP